MFLKIDRHLLVPKIQDKQINVKGIFCNVKTSWLTAIPSVSCDAIIDVKAQSIKSLFSLEDTENQTGRPPQVGNLFRNEVKCSVRIVVVSNNVFVFTVTC